MTCPMIRINPAIIAHAAATTACLMPGRFFLGVGTGENLNEHVTGAKWPAPDERLEMLEIWPNALVEGSASQELPLPKDFEQLVEGREPDELEDTLTLGPGRG